MENMVIGISDVLWVSGIAIGVITMSIIPIVIGSILGVFGKVFFYAVADA